MIKRWNAAPPPRHGGRIPSQDAFISQDLRTFLSSSSHWPTGAPFYPPPVAWPHQQSYRLRSSSFCRPLSPPCTKPARLAKRSTFSLLLHPFVCQALCFFFFLLVHNLWKRSRPKVRPAPDTTLPKSFPSHWLLRTVGRVNCVCVCVCFCFLFSGRNVS